MQISHAVGGITFSVPDGAIYVNRFGDPAVPVNNAAITITGSGLAVNNGTFSLGSTAFYPTLAGFFTEPGGAYSSVTLPGGGLLQYRGGLAATIAGAAVHVGDVVNADQFGPTTPNGVFFNNTDQTVYLPLNSVITATATPEPGACAFLASFGMVGAVFLRSRKQNSQGSLIGGCRAAVNHRLMCTEAAYRIVGGF